MVAVKQEAQKIIQNLPDNCTYEDIQYHLYVVEKIKNGIKRAENGEVSSHQNAKARMAKWLTD
ncbi:MAG: hypothetical protein B5M52_05835 [Helicobacteraceae bacterium 4484_230]|nr:MAG: hypothetical protein B5M52_05835 [Helicobacteraceae bacterium 4484_230]